ncbi:putative receptor protein kinase ZmPK1 [Hordeum vulgare]|nr:putative receptor protein kinase ZmPK1 [Hordeum vulgare]
MLSAFGNDPILTDSSNFELYVYTDYTDYAGIFLLSNGSVFGFGFVLYLLDSNFVFDKDGYAHLESAAGSTLWATNASRKGAFMRLLDSSNLVVLGRDNTPTSPPLWSSFSNPASTLVSSQVFVAGMTLKNMAYRLDIKSGDMMMYYTSLKTPQLYLSPSTDIRTITDISRDIYSAKLGSAYWYLYDRSGSLVSHLFIPNDGREAATNANDTLTAVLGGDGSIAFSILRHTPRRLPDGGGNLPRASPPPVEHLHRSTPARMRRGGSPPAPRPLLGRPSTTMTRRRRG